MQQIYSGSTLTIAASDAKDTSAGFFSYDTPGFQSSSVFAKRSHFTFDNPATGKTMVVQVQDRGGLHNGMTPILQTRGWALQESVLSHRIVRCVQSELYWSCNDGCQTESGVSFPPTANLTWNIPVLNLKDTSDSHKIWWKIIEDYSGRAFTFRKDRVPAMAGLVSYFQDATNDLPCLGMWNRTFHQDLAWMRIERLHNIQAFPNTEWNLPSWTWLSCPGYVIFQTTTANELLDLKEVPMNVNNHVKIVDWHVSWHGHPFTSKLKSTRLIVNGPLQELFIEIPDEAKDFKPPYCIINQNVPRNTEHPIPWRSTVQFDREEWNPAQTWTCLLLQTATDPNEQKKGREDIFLLLESLYSDTELDMYRRVGIGISRDDGSAFSSTVQRTFHMV
jgi:hypothetical protein